MGSYSAASEAARRATLSTVARPRRLLSIAVPTAVTVTAALTLASCSSSGGGSAERFCGEVAANKAALTTPKLSFSNDVGPLLDLYRKIGKLAPLSIQQEWEQLTTAYETANTMVLDDPESEQRTVAAIYSSEKSAAAVDTWLRANCGVDIGPVATLVPHGP
jgi:hypothetical protein